MMIRKGVQVCAYIGRCGAAAVFACATDDYGSPLHPAFMSEIFNF